MQERHEIPTEQVERLLKMREAHGEAMVAVIRAKAALYDAEREEQVQLHRLTVCGEMVAEFLQLDKAKRYKLTADCKAFELGESV